MGSFLVLKRKEKKNLKTKLIVGLTATMLLVTMVLGAIPVRAATNEIVIGIIGPKGGIQWNGLWEGAQLAVADIGGKINIGGTDYTVRLVQIDEASVPTPNPGAGIQNLLSALNAEPQMRYIIGGFRTECVAPIEEACMSFAAANGRPIWIIAGAATDSLITPVISNYARYKYMFRATPMASSVLLTQIATMVRGNLMPKIGTSTMGLIGMWPQEWYGYMPAPYTDPSFFQGPGRLAVMYGDPNAKNISQILGIPYSMLPLPNAEDGCLGGVKVYILADNLAWCEDMVRVLVGNVVYPTLSDGSPNPYGPPPSPDSVLGPYAQVVGYERPSAVETDFSSFIAHVISSGANVIIPIFSATAGIAYTTFYGTLKPPAVSVGINVEGQKAEYWTITGGLCQYETGLMSLGTRTQLNPVPNVVTGKTTVAVWDDYEAAYGHGPIYTMWGCYDAIVALAEPSGLPSLGSWPPASSSTLITLMEATNRTGILGQFKYTDNPVGSGNGKGHDLYTDVYVGTPFWVPAPGGSGIVGQTRSHIPEWLNGKMEVVWPRAYSPYGPALPFATGYKLPSQMYNLADTDLVVDGVVNVYDVATIAPWQQAPAWYLLEADLDGNGFINILDVARVAKDIGKPATGPNLSIP
jgi:hypothetical protein